MLKFKRSITANACLKTGGYNHLTPLLYYLYKQNELRGIYIHLDSLKGCRQKQYLNFNCFLSFKNQILEIYCLAVWSN